MRILGNLNFKDSSLEEDLKFVKSMMWLYYT